MCVGLGKGWISNLEKKRKKMMKEKNVKSFL